MLSISCVDVYDFTIDVIFNRLDTPSTRLIRYELLEAPHKIPLQTSR